jgi:23S rRNA (pseudouridine1915-N3)-methyltransferase
VKLTIAAIGRMKAGPMAELVEIYANRTRQTGQQAGITALNIMDFAESRKPVAQARCAEEAQGLLAACPAGAVIIALDERGKSISSSQFADLISKQLDQGVQDVAFVIGGPDGHAPALRDIAQYTISLGKMTWPHMLARVLLSEQIYRVVTILVNHPYHRD